MTRILFAALVIVGCSLLAEWADAQTAQEMLELRLRSGVVRIRVKKLVMRETSAGNPVRREEWFVGSGFWVDGTDRIVTCAHVVDGARQIDIWKYSVWWTTHGELAHRPPPLWSTVKNEVLMCLMDRSQDIAILKVPAVGNGPSLATPGELQLATATSATKVISVGHTEDVPWRVNYGPLTGRQPAEVLEIPLPGDILLCDVSFGPGSSGGIVVNHQERILGMIEGGKSRGIYGNKIAIPSTTLGQAIQSTGSNSSCWSPIDRSNKTVWANEGGLFGLIQEFRHGHDPGPPPGLWGQVSYGFLTGIDRFDDLVPTLRVDALKPATNALTWTVDLEWAQRSVTSFGEAGTLEFTDAAQIQRLSITGGARFLVGDFGRVSISSGIRAGYAHDRIDHDYTFKSPLIASQSYSRPTSGMLGALGLDIEVQVIGNLRAGWAGEVLQGSGGLGNGVANRFGIRMGVSRVTH